jgi:toxin ParE1/3/4
VAEERSLIFDRDAEEELSAAVSWYDERRPGLGKEFFVAVDETVRLIRQFPEIGKRAPEVPRTSGVRKIAVEGFPYWVVYQELPALLYVVAIAHFRRRPGYWRYR